MRYRSLYLCGVLPVLAAMSVPAIADSARIPVRRATPAKVLRAIQLPAQGGATTPAAGTGALMPEGVKRASVDPAGHALLVEGSPAGIAAFRELVQLLDVQSPAVRMKLRVVHVSHRGSGDWDMETLTEPTIVALNNEKAEMEIKGAERTISMGIVPRVNSDSSVTVQVTGWRVAGPEGALLQAADRACRVRPGQRRMLVGVTSSPDAAVRSAVQRGELPASSDAYEVFYLQLTSAETQMPAR